MSQSVGPDPAPEPGPQPFDEIDPPDHTTARPRGLWRDGNFVTMWTGQALSQFGAQVTELAIPVLAVLLLHASELEVGILGAAGTAAFLVIGLPAGAWIDRMRKRHVMIWADLVRAVALATLPLLWWLGALEIWHMVAVALVMSVATVFFDVSYQSIVPSLVRDDQIADANGKLQATSELAGIAGPAAGGWLIGVITAPFAILVTAATYVVSMLALLRTRDSEVVVQGSHDPLVRSIREGLAWVFGNPYLRRIVGTTAVSNFFATLTTTLLPIFILRTLSLSPAVMGLIFMAGSLGGLAGAFATAHIVRWVGEARAVPLSAIAFSVFALILPVAAVVPEIAVPLLIVQNFLMIFAVLVYNITQVTFRQRITPKRLLGRMNASIRFCVWGVMPIAALLAGGLGTWVGTTATLWIGSFGALLSAVFVTFGPFWTRDLPRAASTPDPAAP